MAEADNARSTSRRNGLCYASRLAPGRKGRHSDDVWPKYSANLVLSTATDGLRIVSRTGGKQISDWTPVLSVKIPVVQFPLSPPSINPFPLPKTFYSYARDRRHSSFSGVADVYSRRWPSAICKSKVSHVFTIDVDAVVLPIYKLQNILQCYDNDQLKRIPSISTSIVSMISADHLRPAMYDDETEGHRYGAPPAPIARGLK
ncbi:hypothetical protein EVAR_14993_1 [Eumeta japonica]|uniref:Uncharacterized protein n=1 Tax=Eumeta variegata TaxID=151549 RepID=A0A4C1X7Y2_EUMVA|nr:hypothetical protein EVAR_14993_1 [Eumeta japonica]